MDSSLARVVVLCVLAFLSGGWLAYMWVINGSPPWTAIFYCSFVIGLVCLYFRKYPVPDDTVTSNFDLPRGDPTAE
jgi:MFS family permease